MHDALLTSSIKKLYAMYYQFGEGFFVGFAIFFVVVFAAVCLVLGVFWFFFKLIVGISSWNTQPTFSDSTL